MAFLNKIAKEFLDRYGSDIHKIVFVFPTRRARLYFLRHLQEQKAKNTTIWAPPAFSINDFIVRLTGRTVSDQLDLIFELFAVYRKHIRYYPREFQDFYPWGKMILSDFDEIDKYLIDTGELFRTLKEFKEIEDIDEAEKSSIYNRYTGFWKDLGLLYCEFKTLLDGKNKAYEGMLYRQAAENIADIASSQGSGGGDWEKAVFCGFNAMARAEETIIHHLLDTGRAEIFWDVDHYFADDENQEAGHFFRENVKTLKLEDPRWVDDNLAQTKHIKITGVQSRVGQAKVLGLELRRLQESITDPQGIAVVLPDESLLFPALNSLPESVNEVNVTIGFPLQQTPVFSLFDSIMEMQERVREGSGANNRGFYYKDVRKVLSHPYIKPLAPDEIAEIITAIKKENLIYIEKDKIVLSSAVLNGLFQVRSDSRESIEFFLELINEIRAFYRENKPDLFSVDYEYMYHFYTLMNRLKDSLKTTGLLLPPHTFRQLFSDIVKNDRIPFTGEPLVGLQIMGMLETQTLDFDNLFILSVNEGHLPPGKSRQSFIPFDVRTIMKLPTYKDRDAIAAYHFYRLLKSSRNITLLYTTEARGVEKSEKSRFIDQLLIEYAERNKNVQIDHEIIDFTFDSARAKEISIAKNDEILRRLAQKTYSSSSLLTYLSCSLKFYFTYILKLYEEEEVYESPDYRLIGNIIHEILRRLYEPFAGAKSDAAITGADIEQVKQLVDQTLRAVYMEELKTGDPADIDTGRNRIAVEVMKRFLDNFFEKERRRAPFRVLMLERKIDGVSFAVSSAGRQYTVGLEGTIDRVDEQGGVFQIIDYKTGKVNSLAMKAESFAEQLAGPDAVNRKEVFQLLFYRYLLKRSGGYDGEYRLGIYPFKTLNEELAYVAIDKNETIGGVLVEEFEDVLGEIFQGLFDDSQPFIQTEEEKNCRYCPYLNICGREPQPDYVR